MLWFEMEWDVMVENRMLLDESNRQSSEWQIIQLYLKNQKCSFNLYVALKCEPNYGSLFSIWVGGKMSSLQQETLLRLTA